jgi:hypothetical protein
LEPALGSFCYHEVVKKVKIFRNWFAIVIFGLILALGICFILRPVDSYTFSTSGCVGLGTSTTSTKRYSLVKSEKQKFYQDKSAISQFQFNFTKALCDTDTETHNLYLF